MNDEEILDLFFARDEAAIAATAQRYGAYCHTIARNILPSPEDVEECVNDTYLQAWKSIPPGRPARLSAYLGKLTRNLSLNRHKQATADKRGGGQIALALSELEDCVSGGDMPHQLTEQKALAQAIDRFLRGQSPLRRGVFVRRYWFLYSVRDIAAHYDISESKTASLLFRVRNDLKAYLQKEDFDV